MDFWGNVGDWLLLHRSLIRRGQWAVVAIYAALLTVPAALPMPDHTARIWSDVTRFAQFVFWGVWWPFVLLSMVLVGRAWCGLLCPEGALSEAASRRGRGRAVPGWIRWPGWPFAAFATTTLYGQLASVYQYPGPALVVLGGSTLAAVAVGFAFGRNKRVWCRYLCPVGGVFGLLAKLAPLHFRTDADAWANSQRMRPKLPVVDCAPMVPLRTMRGSSACHMCGRCSGFRGAIRLARRSPNHEIVHVAGIEPKPWETVLIVLGLIGLAMGAFLWSASPCYVVVKQAVAAWLVERDWSWPLGAVGPWWLLTNYPEANDVMTVLDGTLVAGFMLAAAIAAGVTASIGLAGATRALGPWSWSRFHHLAQALIPTAGCGVFLGLSALTVAMLADDGLTLPWIDALRAAMLGGSTLWSGWLGWSIAGLYAASRTTRIAAMVGFAGALAVALAGSLMLFWGV